LFFFYVEGSVEFMNDRRILTYVKKIVLYENIYYVILTKKNCLFFKAVGVYVFLVICFMSFIAFTEYGLY